MADREKGVINMVMSQVVPFNDPKTLTPWLAAEKVVYDSLGAETESLEKATQGLKLNGSDSNATQ